MAAPPSIAFVTTCKGRLMHVQETLPLIVAQAPDEIIFVDYSCPQKSGDWVEENYPGVKVVRVVDDPGFCLPRARNIGAAASSTYWLCFIDADIKIAPGFVDWMRTKLHPSFHWRASRMADGERDPETWGTFLCTRSAFRHIGGYDDVFRGWGGEDDDLYQRLAVSGVPEMKYPSTFVEPIRHDDTLRVANHAVKNRKLQGDINRVYRELKMGLMMGRNEVKAVAPQTRRNLMKKVEDSLRLLDSDPQAPPQSINARLETTVVLSDEYELVKTNEVTFQVRRRTGEPPA